MNMLKRSNKILEVRPYENKDFKSWQNAFLNISAKPRNKYDIIRPRDAKKLTLRNFNKTLKMHAKNRKDDFYYSFGIFLRDGTMVGHVSIMDVSRGIFQNAYLGYSLMNSHWGKGYGKQAVKFALDIAFKDLKLHRVEAGIEPKNTRSIALAKSVGLRREGFSKKRLFLRGKWEDIVQYVALSEEYKVKIIPT